VPGQHARLRRNPGAGFLASRGHTLDGFHFLSTSLRCISTANRQRLRHRCRNRIDHQARNHAQMDSMCGQTPVNASCFFPKKLPAATCASDRHTVELGDMPVYSSTSPAFERPSRRQREMGGLLQSAARLFTAAAFAISPSRSPPETGASADTARGARGFPVRCNQ